MSYRPNGLLCASSVLNNFPNFIQFALKVDKFVRRAIENVDALPLRCTLIGPRTARCANARLPGT